MTIRGFSGLAMPFGARVLTAPASAETFAHLGLCMASLV